MFGGSLKVRRFAPNNLKNYDQNEHRRQYDWQSAPICGY